MQGIFVHGARPASKAAIRRAVAADPSSVRLEATSMFGNEYDGPVSSAPDGSYLIVGPDPYSRRNFYGKVTVRAGIVNVK